MSDDRRRRAGAGRRTGTTTTTQSPGKGPHTPNPKSSPRAQQVQALIAMGLSPAGGSPGDAVQLLASRVLTGSAANIDITSIASQYSHLQLYVAARSTSAVTNAIVKATFNGDTGSHYNYYMAGFFNGSADNIGAVGQAALEFGFASGGSSTAGSFGVTWATILNYAGTTNMKGLVGTTYLNGNDISTGQGQWSVGAMWTQTSGINQITFSLATGNLDTGSFVYLYGIS